MTPNPRVNLPVPACHALGGYTRFGRTNRFSGPGPRQPDPQVTHTLGGHILGGPIVKILIVSLVAVVVSGLCSAPRASGMDDPYRCEDILGEKLGINYESRILEVFFGGSQREHSIRLVVKPSFAAEWAVTAFRDGDVFQVETVVATRQLWDANHVRVDTPDGREAYQWSEHLVSVPVARKQREIPAAVGEALERLWKDILRDPIDRSKAWTGLDGTVYTFTQLFGGVAACAELWSPREGSRGERLVTLCNRLLEFVESNSQARRAALEQWILREATDLVGGVPPNNALNLTVTPLACARVAPAG